MQVVRWVSGVSCLVLSLGGCGDDPAKEQAGPVPLTVAPDTTQPSQDSTVPSISIPTGGACEVLGSMVEVDDSWGLLSLSEDPDREEATVAELIDLGFQRVSTPPPAWNDFVAIVALEPGLLAADVTEELEAAVPGPAYVAVEVDDYVAELRAAWADRPRLRASLDRIEFDRAYVRIADADDATLEAIRQVVESEELGGVDLVSELLEGLDEMAPGQLPVFLRHVTPHLEALVDDDLLGPHAAALLAADVQSIADADALYPHGDALLTFAEQECGLGVT